MSFRLLLPLLGLTAGAAGPVLSKDMGPGTVVGRVVETPGNLEGRKLFVQAGREKWALHCGETTRIFHARRKVSVHDITEGMYVRAHGRRIGRLRLQTYRVDIAGDRLAFRRSDAYRRSAPEGYFTPR